jgi:lipoprotein-anchoring transpeptidase ErfK/SrfK
MSEKARRSICPLIVTMGRLLVVAVVISLLSTLFGWVTGLPARAALAVTGDADSPPPSPSPTPAAIADSVGPSETPATAVAGSAEPVIVPTEVAAEPTPVPASAPLSYTVGAGDTLGAIAQAYGVSVGDLVATNGLANPDVLYVGQVLVMPEGSTPALTATARESDPAEVSSSSTPMPTPVPEPGSPETIGEDRWIDVDLSGQLLTAYEGNVPVRSYPVSTGLPATPTPEGQFRIWIKLRYDDMAGADYYIEDVPFVMYFHEGYGLHGVTWHGNFGYPMSHGCVNLPTEEAEWLFEFADVGTLVNIHS